MKKIVFLCIIAGVTFAACNQPAEKAEEQVVEETAPAAAEAAAPELDSAAMAKMWMDYMTPGEMHALLASQNGKWNMEMTSWMEPGAEPGKSSGVCVYDMALGDRYQHCKLEAMVMGMPFEGMGYTAFDNTKKKFVNTWMDNMGTGIIVMEGDYDAAAKQMNLKGTVSDIFTGKDKTMREVFRFIDDNNMLMEVYDMTPDGTEFKSLEIKYTRA